MLTEAALCTALPCCSGAAATCRTWTCLPAPLHGWVAMHQLGGLCCSCSCCALLSKHRCALPAPADSPPSPPCAPPPLLQLAPQGKGIIGLQYRPVPCSMASAPSEAAVPQQDWAYLKQSVGERYECWARSGSQAAALPAMFVTLPEGLPRS